MPRPIVATIHLDSMQHNLARARTCAPQARAWAVVKANGYGHGLERALRGFAAADGLALVEFDNAVRLRELGWTKPIMLLEGFFDPSDIETMVRHGFNGAVHCVEQIAWLEAAQREGKLSSKLDLHLKMNTGMNRLGFMPDAYAAAHARLRRRRRNHLDDPLRQRRRRGPSAPADPRAAAPLPRGRGRPAGAAQPVQLGRHLPPGRAGR